MPADTMLASMPASSPRYFDQYPKAQSSSSSSSATGSATRTSNAKGRQLLASSGRSYTDEFLYHDTDKYRRVTESTYSFPTYDGRDDPVTTPKQSSSSSSRKKSSSSKRQHQHSEKAQNLGQELENNPYFTSNFSQHLSVVTAPVPGVATMDAMVDGMNELGLSHSSRSRPSGRSRYSSKTSSAVYEPPLPKPPPGVVLGGGKVRKSQTTKHASSTDEDDSSPTTASSRRKSRHPADSYPSPTPSRRTSQQLRQSTMLSKRKSGAPSITSSIAQSLTSSTAPSIDEIIRAHTYKTGYTTPRISRTPSFAYGMYANLNASDEDKESEPEPLTAKEEAEFMNRSSIDSIANEAQQTLQNIMTTEQNNAARTAKSEHSSSTSNDSEGNRLPNGKYFPLDTLSLAPTADQQIAQYLKSTRLTNLIKCTRHPHASRTHPLTVSVSDLGSQTGMPIVLFLGLGCVRHVTGLYDEMAELLGLRLITIDRWGVGKTTEPTNKSARGVAEWASVVVEVLDRLGIEQCSIMAHSAGAPYALSFANKVPERVRGDICLLAPWVGGTDSSGYKWLKYVPNGILKTAQAAEWRVQAWMLGKPPAVIYQGIGYDAKTETPLTSPIMNRKASSRRQSQKLTPVYSQSGGRAQQSTGTFSDYDHLDDFDGRFQSRETLGASFSKAPSLKGYITEMNKGRNSRSKSFLGKLKVSRSASTPDENSPKPSSKTLRGLRSFGSLRGKSNNSQNLSSPSIADRSLTLPLATKIDAGLGLDNFDWSQLASSRTPSPPPLRSDTFSSPQTPKSDRSSSNHDYNSRRSAYSNNSSRDPMPLPTSPVASTYESVFSSSQSASVAGSQAALGSALIAASHAEAAKGLHSDFLQILNHDNKPWGFSYDEYPHKVRIWYGDRDEKIAENAVRWMERTMGSDRCQVKVVRGADHSLMYKSSVVIEVLESLKEQWC